MNEFQIIHAYRALARRGFAEPLGCPVCNTEYTVRIDKDDNPALECMFCDNVATPGEGFYTRLRAKIAQHDNERA